MTTHTLSVSASAPAQRSPLQGLMGPCVRGAVFVALVTGLAYPLLTTGVAQLLLPAQASGSLVHQGEAIVGSQLIGQQFTAANFFHTRPSSTTATDPQDASQTVAAPYNAGASAGSNQGPTNAALIDAVAQRAAAYRAANGLAVNAVLPVDAVTASASGLDPHISVVNAQLQVARVARARGLAPAQVQALVATYTEDRLLGLLGEPRVNVLALNLALEAQAPRKLAARTEGIKHVQ